MPIDPSHVTLITDYIAWQKSLREDSPPGDYARTNALALRCMVELPVALWERVIDAVIDPLSEGALSLALDLRKHVRPDDPMPAKLIIWHSPGAGKATR